jgi:hypothetical protein
MVGAMRLNRLFYVMIAVSLLSPLFLVDVTTAEDIIENKVNANFGIEFNTATYLEIHVTMDVDEATAFDVVYDSTGIERLATSTNTSDIEALGVIKYLLHSSVKDQLETAFENANVVSLNDRPIYENSVFYENCAVNLTSTFFDMNEAVDAYALVNGVLDMGAEISYTFNTPAEAGWLNTFTYTLPSSVRLVSANTQVTDLYKNEMTWTADNRSGDARNAQATMSIQTKTPSTPKQTSEEITLEFDLDGRDARSIDLNTNILAKSVDIRNYSILPDFITNLDFVTSDGIRLFIDNGLTSWDSFYNKTIKPVETAAISTIEKSSLNQTLTTSFSWNPETTTNCSTPYDITNMNKEPPIKAKLLNKDIKLKICDVSARALFGLIDSGATANISSTDINFGDRLGEIGYPYNGSFYLPGNISLSGEKIYKWNQSEPISGEFKSDDAPEYSGEKIQTTIDIEFSGLDLNLFGLFTGKAELTSKLYLKETSNYYVTTLPDEFTLPSNIKLGYLNSDAFRLCVEENVFVGEDVNEFLANEKILFETRLAGLLPGLKINGLVKRDDFDRSVASWDGEITNMDADTPVTTVSDAHSSYPVSFGLSLSPPKFEITEQSLSLVGLQNQNVTYRIVLPRGTTIDASDSLDRLVPGKTDDGRDYIEISFDASEAGIIDVVSFKIVPSPLFALSIFLPCIVCLLIAIVLIIAILIVRKKRKGFGGKRSRPKKTKEIKEDEEEESGGYEEQEYYVPPPPSSKK